MNGVEEVGGILSYFNNNLGTLIISAILLLDTIRAIIAMMGWINPDAKYAWIVYGRYKSSLIATGLKELGFESQRSSEIAKNLRSISKQERETYGINEKNAAEQLIILLAKYIVHFDQPIQYGGKRTTTSSYYFDTMEMSHNQEDLQVMTSIMVKLYASKGNKEKPQVIVTPKGGNPLFAQSVAKYYTAFFVVAKSKNDKSRITSVGDGTDMDFRINYEGSWRVADTKSKEKTVIVDCNTSGASQLIDIISDLKKFSEGNSLPIVPPEAAYVLFRADLGRDVDQLFSDYNCKLYRFFDLDEELKNQIYQLKVSVGDNRSPDLYYENDKKQVSSIIQNMKSKKLYYYDDQSESSPCFQFEQTNTNSAEAGSSFE